MSSDKVRELLDRIMVDVQVYTSTYALIGSRFDRGQFRADAEEAKTELRAAIEAALSQPAPVREAVEALEKVRAAFIVEHHANGDVASVGYDSKALREIVVPLLDKALASLRESPTDGGA